jgi:hypothetical protein
MKLRIVVLDVAILLAFGSVVTASPTTFAPGEPLGAAKLNSSLADADRRLAKLESRHDTGATYCGFTATATKGDLSALAGAQGYVGAKAACVKTCGGSPTARVCSADDMVRSASNGMTIRNGWFAAGVAVPYSSNGSVYYVTDCSAFTTASGTVMGQTWTPTGTNYHWCSEDYPVLCCDVP